MQCKLANKLYSYEVNYTYSYDFMTKASIATI